MANTFQALAQSLFKKDSLRPQSITTDVAGASVDVSSVGTNYCSAVLGVGAVNTLTSLAVKIQVSTDGSNNWTDVSGATFTTVTAANAVEVIDFQLPTAASTTASPYKYARATAAIVGTSALAYCAIVGCKDQSGSAAYLSAPPTIN